MAWITLVESGSLEEFAAATPAIDELPKWTKLKLRFELPWWAPIGNIIEIAPESWWVDKLAPGDITVTDVRGGWCWLEVDGYVDPPHPSLLVIALFIAALASLAFGISAIIKAVRLDVDIPGGIGISGWVIFIGIVVLLVAFRKPISKAVMKGVEATPPKKEA